MNCRAMVAVATWMTLTVSWGSSVSAQALLQPTPPPLVTAENEPWYLEGEPIFHAGNLYYPAGAQIFFNPNEMVRSGFHFGVPLYTRTTIEPFSIVYVPLAGGRMQPYERRRSGELVGTSGSQPASLLTPYDPRSAADLMPQAPGPPARAPIVVSVPYPHPVDVRSEAASVGRADDRPGAVGTSDRVPQARPRHVRIGGRPQGINAVYIEYAGTRWYSAGRAVPVDPNRMSPAADFKGFRVWRDRTDSELIYAASTTRGDIAVPYSKRKIANLEPERESRP